MLIIIFDFSIFACLLIIIFFKSLIEKFVIYIFDIFFYYCNIICYSAYINIFCNKNTVVVIFTTITKGTSTESAFAGLFLSMATISTFAVFAILSATTIEVAKP